MKQSPSLSSKPKAKPQQFSFTAIGTAWSVEIYDAVATDRLRRRVLKRIEQFDAAYSRFRENSLVSRAALYKGKYHLPADGFALLEFYHSLYVATGGLVTPLIGQTLVDAGYDASYSLQPKATVSAAPAWEAVIAYDQHSLQLKQPALLDFGAAGKGYLVDLVADVIEAEGISHFCIDASGDILYRQANSSLRVGLEHPDDPSLAIGVAELQNQALCASAPNRRRWGAYHHIMNPHTAKPADRVRATWAVADNTMVADGLATALFFAAPEALQMTYNFEYAVLTGDDQLIYSKGFPATFFTA